MDSTENATESPVSDFRLDPLPMPRSMPDRAMAVANNRESSANNHAAMPRVLRGYQTRAIDQVRQALRTGLRRIVLQLPTGGGKTAIAGAIIAMAREKSRRVMFCVPAISLIDQTVRSFYSDGITEVGVIQADHPMTDYSKPVQVASVQTLARRSVPDVDLVIVDECHVQYAVIHDLMQQWDNVAFIGLSATPWAKGMAKHWQGLVIGASIIELMNPREQYLSDYIAFAPADPDLTGVRTVAGDYHEGQLSTAMQRGTLVGDVVKNWLKHAEYRPTLVFAVDRAHAKKLHSEFERAGIEAGYVDAHTPLEEREEIGKRFNTKNLAVVVNIGTLTTGIDWDVRCIVLARPTKSEMLYIQIIGRGLRMAPGKENLLILDHSGTMKRLGWPEDIQYDQLDDGKPKKESASKGKDEALPKQCPACSFLKPAKVHKCPSCGFAPEKQSTIEHINADLVQLKGDKKHRKYTQQEKENYYRMLIGWCKANGKKEGAAYYKYREKFGVFPSNKFSKEPLKPNAEVLGFIRHQQIKYAKAKKEKRF